MLNVDAHRDGPQHGVSIQISINWVKNLSAYLAQEKLLWPEYWRESLHICLLSFSRFWT